MATGTAAQVEWWNQVDDPDDQAQGAGAVVDPWDDDVWDPQSSDSAMMLSTDEPFHPSEFRLSLIETFETLTKRYAGTIVSSMGKARRF